MHTQMFQDVHIEQDLGIPLSYDAAWKIFNCWPMKVQGQRRLLGEKARHAIPPHRSTEEKIRDTQAQREQPRLKGVLFNLNKWYNEKCAAGASGVLDLSKLGQLKIKYKIPPFEIGKTQCHNGKKNRRQDFDCNASANLAKNHANGIFNTDYGAKGKRAVQKRKKTKEKLPEDCSSSELYYAIENQLRNLSVSQSRLKHMSVSLCRLAYSKRNASKPKPKAYNYRDVHIGINSSSDSSRNVTSKSSSFDSKINSKLSKQSNSSKSWKSSSSSSKNSKVNKNIQTTTSRSSKSNEANSSKKASKSSYTSKSSKQTKTSESSDSNHFKIKAGKNLRFANTSGIPNSAEAGRKKQPGSARIVSISKKYQMQSSIAEAPSLHIAGGNRKAGNQSSRSRTSESYRTVILKPATVGSTAKISTESKTAALVTKNRIGAKTVQCRLSQKRKQQTTGGSCSECATASGGRNMKESTSVRISKPILAVKKVAN